MKKDKNKKLVDLTSKILNAIFAFFLFKNVRIVKAKSGILFFNKLRLAVQALLQYEQSF